MLLICAITILTVALPALQHDFRLSDSQLAVASSAYGVSFSSLLVLGGRVADRFGRRKLLLAGLATFGASSVVGALAPSFVTVVLARFGQGVGAAMAAPAAMAFLPLLYPEPARRSRALATWGGLAGIGAVIGMVLSGLLAQWASWRWTFALLVALALPTLLAAARVLPRDTADRARRVDLPGAALAVGGLSILCYGVLEGSGLLLAVAGTILALFVLIERHIPEPLIPLTFFASRRRNLGLVTILLMSAGMATSLFVLSLHLQRESGLSPVLTLAVFAPFGLLLTVTGAAAGRLLRRHGPGRLLVAGLAIAAVGLALVAPLSGALLPLGTLLLPVGIGLTFAAATVLAASDVPDADAGLTGGVINTAMEAGPTVGLAVLVALATTHQSGYSFALAATATALVLTAVTAAALLRPKKFTDRTIQEGAEE